MSTQTVKMVIMSTGEHILGYVTEETDEAVTIEKPVSLVPDPNSQGRSMMFIPYLQFSTEDTAPFPRREIRHVLTPQPNLAEGYDKQFGVGLVTPDQGLVDSSGLKLV